MRSPKKHVQGEQVTDGVVKYSRSIDIRDIPLEKDTFIFTTEDAYLVIKV